MKRKCAVCDKSYERPPSAIGKCCSPHCAAVLKFPQGKKHPAYKNGSGRGYNHKILPLSIELLGNDCQICGTSEEVITHHKDRNPRNNPLDGSNWQRLCKSCHTKLHWKPRKKFKNYMEGIKFHYLLKKWKKKIIIQNAVYEKFNTMKYLTTNEVCKKEKLSKERIRQLRNINRIDYIKIGGMFYYPISYSIRHYRSPCSKSKFRKIYKYSLKELAKLFGKSICWVCCRHKDGSLAERLKVILPNNA